MKPPKAQKIEKIISLHGDQRRDDYYWLNDRNSPHVVAYLEAENQYAESVMAPVKDLQQEVFREMKDRYAPVDESVPYYFEGYWYSAQYRQAEEYPVFVRRKNLEDKEFEILLDVNPLAVGHEYFDVDRISVSPCGKFLAYSWDTIGEGSYTISFKDLTSERLLEDSIKDCTGKLVWSEDSKQVFYVRLDESFRAFEVVRHEMGTKETLDKVVFLEEDTAFDVHVSKTKDQKYVLIQSSSSVTDESWFLPSNCPFDSFTLIQERTKGLEYSVEHFEGDFYIITNHAGASNFKMMKAPVEKCSENYWVDWIVPNKEVLLEGFELFKNYLVLEERVEGLMKIRILNLRTGSSHYLPFQEACYSAFVGMNMEFNTSLLRYSYSSLTHPTTTYTYNMDNGEVSIVKVQQVMEKNFHPDNYISDRIWAIAEDGKKIPISFVRHKDTPVSEATPLLLYGYGSYGQTVDAFFSIVRLSLLDRGFIYAIAHVRGGEYLGRDWYEKGKMLHKKNTFTDFISVAKHLIHNGYTSSSHLYAMGGSAGGLLIGAVINQEPELFHGAIAQVPFVDVLTTMMDESLPLTAGELEEWGNPQVEQHYNYMKSYSPYDNVGYLPYPNLLITTGINDKQVPYWEPAKWVAKLREHSTSKNQILLHCDMNAGHNGGTGRFESLKDEALEVAFLLKLEAEL